MNKKLKKGLTISTAAMAMGVAVPVVTVMAAPVTANGWVQADGKWYYYVNGVKLVNAWAQDSHGWCFLGADGAAIQEGWAKDSIGWCYIRNYSWVNHATWAKDSAGWQFIGTNGYWDASVAPLAVNPIDTATAAVVKAEASKLKADVDAAKAAVAALKGAVPETEALTARINAINVTFEVKSVSVLDAKHINVVFSQPVDQDTAEDTDNYDFIGTGDFDDLALTEAEVQDDGVTVKLTVDAPYITNDTDAEYTVKINDVENKDGKAIPDYKEVLSLYDNVKPTVDSLDLIDRDTLEITFSEDVVDVNGDALETGDIEVLDDVGDVQAGLTLVETDDANVYQIQGLYSLGDGDYTLQIKGTVYDLAGNKISPSLYEEDFTLEEDDVKPYVKSVTSVSKEALKVVFSEPVDPESIDITIGTDPYDYLDFDAEYDTENNTEFIVNVGPYSDTHKVIIESGYTDYADNSATKDYTKYVKFANNGPVLSSTSASIRTFGGDKYAVFTFDQDITLNDEDLDGYYVDADDAEFAVTIPVGTVRTSANMGEYLDADQIAIPFANLDKGDYTITLPDGFVEAYGAGSDEVDVTFSVTTTETADVSLESITQADDVNVIYVTFTDTLGNSAINAANYTVDGVKVFSKAVFVAGTDKTQVKLTLKSGAIKYDGDYALETSNILDENGNDVEDYNADAELATYTETYLLENVKPYVLKAKVIDVDTIEITFNEEIVNFDEITEDDFTVIVEGDTLDTSDFTVETELAAAKVWTITVDKDMKVDAVVKAGTSADFDGEDINGNVGQTDSMKTATW